MRLGVLSDAHGNADATRACIAALADARVDELVFLGDACGYLPEVREVLDILETAGAHALLGNHEAMLLGMVPADPAREAVYRLDAARDALPAESLALLRGRLPWRAWSPGGRRVLCVHGSPWNPLSGYVYPDDDLDGFRSLPFDVVFMGHTHRPFVHAEAGRLVVNVGSCGLPRDVGDLACCAVYDSEAHTCELLRVRFDAAALSARYGERLHPAVHECLARR